MAANVDPRRSFVHRAMMWLLLTGCVGAGLATSFHYSQQHAVGMDRIIPPAMLLIFVGLAWQLHRQPEHWRRVAWASFGTSLLGVALPAWYFPLTAAARGVRLVDVLPPISTLLLPMLLMLVIFAKPRQVLLAAAVSWALIAVPILVYLGLHPDELTSPRGHDLAMTLGPVMVIMVIYIGFHRNIDAAMQELRKREEELSRLAERDALTGLYNRRAGESYLLKLQAGMDHSVALILFDIDHFKRINDQHGHPAGDAVLREVATRSSHALRPSDVLARWGGEEFLVLASVVDAAQAAQIAEQLRAAICAAPYELIGGVSASFGVSVLAAAESQDQALQRVDQALYRAKAQGRNCVVAV